ncbi:unnamed protein product [Schistosoma curassoni]|uniref:DUF768 domain-containing protein n=1 Tax=Schistosoma curassoni TaxID=6186 RepID=A0A183K0X4_9TREM|nr:unnamed protein product [Schistosoma curassoni]
MGNALMKTGIFVKYWRLNIGPAPMNPPDIEAAHKDLPIDVNPPTTEQIRMVFRQIKSGEAAEPHNIPPEALKLDIEVTTNMLYLLFKKI